MIATTTETLTRPGEPTHERESSRRRTGVEVTDGGAQLMAFDLVLDVAKSSLEARARQSGSGSTAPAQMFEPAEPDAHGQRQASLRAEAQREASTSPAERFDKTSVAARRETAGGTDGGGSGFSSTTGSAKEATALDAGDASVRALPVRSGVIESSAAGPQGPERRGANDSSAAREVRPATAAESQPAVETWRDGVGGMAGAVKSTVAGQQSAPANGPEGVAARVGQVLGASRVGGSESARAPQGAEPAQEGRAQPQTQRQPSRATPSEPSSGEKPSSRAETSEPTKPFDELVRSIRLRSGSYRSSAKMHLNPPELGRVSIDVRMEGERLHLDVRTEHAEAAKLLHERVAQLRAALAEHGILIDRFDVATRAFETGDGFVAPDGSTGESSGRDAGQRHGVSSGASDADRMRDGRSGELGPELDQVMTVAERRLDVRI